MIEIGAFALAGLLWVGVLISTVRDRSGSRWVRTATIVILAAAVPIVTAAYLVYGRG